MDQLLAIYIYSLKNEQQSVSQYESYETNQHLNGYLQSKKLINKVC